MTNNINLVIPDDTDADVTDAYSQVFIGSNATADSTVQNLTNFVFQGNQGTLVTPSGRVSQSDVNGTPTAASQMIQDFYAGPITLFQTGDTIITSIGAPFYPPGEPPFDDASLHYNGYNEELSVVIYNNSNNDTTTFVLTISGQLASQYTGFSFLVGPRTPSGAGITIYTSNAAPTLSVAVNATYAQSTVTAGPGVEQVTAAGITQNLLLGQSMQFQDGTLSFDRAAFEPQNTNLPIIFRFYETALGRAPDALGENVWNADINQGLTMIGLATGVLDSGEHQAVFGVQSDYQFVTQLYETGLGHAPGQAGYDYWLGQLSGGASREQVLFGISQSQEAINYNAGIMSAGVFKPNT